MPAATIIFFDIVAFSRKTSEEQRLLVDELNRETIYDLRGYLSTALQSPGAIALPTGDGVALAFVHASERRWNWTALIAYVIHMQKWAKSSGVSLRCGIHVGVVDFVADVNDRLNVCGDAINYARRVMDACDPRQVLISDSAYREHVGLEGGLVTIEGDCTAGFGPVIDVQAKHGLRLGVHKMTLSPAQDWLCNDDPQSASVLEVSLTPLPKEIGGSFAERLSRASEVALVQLTGENLIDAIDSGAVTLSESIKRFWVLMPEPGAYARYSLPPEQPKYPRKNYFTV